MDEVEITMFPTKEEALDFQFSDDGNPSFVTQAGEAWVVHRMRKILSEEFTLNADFTTIEVVKPEPTDLLERVMSLEEK